jgi:lysophospholipase L1-like esterase
MNAPCETNLSVPSNGTYTLEVRVTAKNTTPYIILCESRRWLYEGELSTGETKLHRFTVNVCDIHKFGTDYVKQDCLTVGVMGDVSYTCTAVPCSAPTIYIAGDSTVTDQPAEYPYNPSSTYCGWGQMLPLYLTEGIAVSNHAQSGSTTAEFMQANWTVVKDRLKEGDFLVVEFGHNDQKIKELDAYGGYAKNLRYYIDEARARGANPILCSPINRIIFEPDGTLKNLLGEYRNAVKSVAEEQSVPFIDLWSRTTEYMQAAGPEDAWDYFWGDGKTRDYTHTNDTGGKLVAKFVAQEIEKIGIQPVASHIKTDEIKTTLPTPSGKKNTATNINDYRTVGLVNLPDLDKDITNI